jgi:hypothetical protein
MGCAPLAAAARAFRSKRARLMVRLSDTQLQDVMTVAASIPYPLRAAFLRALAAELGGRDGDGEVHRAALRAGKASCRGCKPSAAGRKTMLAG